MTDELKIISPKRIVIILLVGIGIVLLIPKLIGLKHAFDLLKEVKYWAFILALMSESFFYIGSTVLTRTVLRMTNNKLSFYDVLKISVMDSFSVQFLPLGSFGETLVDYYFYRAKNIRTSHIVLMFISRTIIIWLVFGLIYLVGVAFSPTNNNLGPNRLMIVWIVYFLALGFFFYLISLYYRRATLLKRASTLASITNKFTRVLHIKRIPLEKIPELVENLYRATGILARNRRLQFEAGLGALIFWLGDIFCLYFALLGFGFKPHLAIVIFAYTIARILALVSFLPGGLGITEGTLVLILIGFGIPTTTALAGVLIFRFISFWIPIPIGLWSFLTLQKKFSNNLKKE